MRNNQPTTNRETEIPEGVYIYSRTDVSGIIADANQAFADVSGFSIDELVGQNHNMVRHPDMPEEAFADMWASLKRNMPWRGVVKNRTKDGGYYWVVATVNAVRENGRVAGYVSVRTRPTREEVSAASQAYERIRNGDKSISILNGSVVKSERSLFSRLFIPENMANIAAGAASFALLVSVGSHYSGKFGDASAYLSIASLLGLAAWFIAGRSSRDREIELANEALDKILGSGNLTLPVPHADSGRFAMFAGKVNLLVASVRATVQGMDDVASIVAGNSSAARDAMSRVKANADEQKASTVSSAAMTEELSNSIASITIKSNETGALSKSSDKQAEEVSKISNSACDAIEATAAAMSAAAQGIKNLEERSKKIGTITARIKAIANQTNLLALNAAIEAARAGEAGRGFAVVADEVRKLSEGASESSEEIAALLDAFQKEIAATEKGIGGSGSDVGNSVQLVRESRDSMTAISGSMRGTLGNMAEIAESIKEQSVAIELLSKIVADISTKADSSSKDASIADESTRRLESAAKRMRLAVKQYTV